jgi:hypothetical protein
MHSAGKEFRQTAELNLATGENLDQNEKSESIRCCKSNRRDILDTAH